MLSNILLIGWQLWTTGVCVLYNSEKLSDISELNITKLASNTQHLQIMDNGVTVKCTQHSFPQKDFKSVEVPIYVSHDGGQNFEKLNNAMSCGELKTGSGKSLNIETIMCNTCNYTDFIIRSSCFLSVSTSSFQHQKSSEHVGQNGSERRTDDSEFNLKIVLFISLITLLTLMLRELSERSAMIMMHPYRVVKSIQSWIKKKLTTLMRSILKCWLKFKSYLADILETISWDAECKNKANTEQSIKQDLYYWSNNADVIRVNNEIIDRRESEVYLNNHSFLHPGRKKPRKLVNSRVIDKQKTGRAITKAK
jgi:hypothetical protein